MSWYVESLIRNSWYIKNQTEDEVSTDFDELAGYSVLQDSVYDDLLSVEVALRKLDLTKKELEIVRLLCTNADISSIAKETHLSRPTTAERIKSITDRVALILGDYFTNDGFSKYICDKNGYDRFTRVTIKTFLDKK